MAKTVCTDCNFEPDKTWTKYTDKNYGQIWLEVGVCRSCWFKFIAKSEEEDQAEDQAKTWRYAF